MFHNNLGFTDIGIRYGVMMIVMILAGVFQSMWLVVLGVLVFLTAITGWCPIYNMIGFSTRRE
jgi:hypothetical protein